MISTTRWPLIVGFLGLLVLTLNSQTQPDVVVAQTRQPVLVTRVYTGPDGQSHAEDIEVPLTNDVSEMLKVTGAEIHRTPAGTVNSDWHTAPRRQFVITLSGRGEVEVAGGKKISMEPGHIMLVEDLTGKGHITRMVGSEDRVTIQLPFADQLGR